MRVQNVRREGSSGRAKWALAVALAAAALGCALGPEQEPGCHRDTDCGEGFACRAGACFLTTTDRSSPATDAGDDAPDDAD